MVNRIMRGICVGMIILMSGTAFANLDQDKSADTAKTTKKAKKAKKAKKGGQLSDEKGGTKKN